MVTLDQAGRRFGRIRFQPAGPRLRGVVDHCWIEVADGSREAVEEPWRIVPDPSGYLLFQIEDTGHAGRSGERRRVCVVGPRRRWKDIDLRRRRATIGFRLHAGTVGELFEISADEIADRSVAIEDLLGRVGAELFRRVSEIRELEGVAAEMGRFLERRFHRAGGADWRVAATRDLIGRRRGRLGAADVAAQLEVAPRTLRAVLRRHAGISTKRFAGLVRLHHAIRLGQRSPAPSWRDVALATGYYDQAHMIREFRALVGETPAQFLRRAG